MIENNDKNVYILGAGFSAEAGLPLMNDFLDKARNLWKVKYPEFAPVFEYQRNLLSASRTIAHNVDNIEELFGLIELNIDVEESEKTSQTRAALLDLICKTIIEYDATKHLDASNSIRIPITNVDKSSLIDNKLYSGMYLSEDSHSYKVDIYRYFSGLVTRLLEEHVEVTDTVITFNYDTVLDKILKRFPISIDYVINRDRIPPTVKRIKLLKMHGSIGFFHHETCKKIQIINDYEPESTLICPSCSEELSQSSPLIVPPTWNKSAYRDSVLQIWKECYEELKTARRIIVIGYSLPETDVFFKHLLTLALSQNDFLDKFIVVDISQEVDKKFRSLVYNKFQRNYRFIDKGLKEFLFYNFSPHANWFAEKAYTRHDINYNI